jgi:hypothetical protein
VVRRGLEKAAIRQGKLALTTRRWSWKNPFWALGYLSSLLAKVRAAVEQDGELIKGVLQETHLAGEPNALTEELAALRAFPLVNPDGLDEAAGKPNGGTSY